MIVFLVGYMGCGKTTIGRRLARRLGYDFSDTDDRIEKQEGADVCDIFHYAGEEYFRKAERGMLEQLIASGDDLVVSTGGLPVWADNMARMNGAGLTVYIRRSAEQITARLSPHGRWKRPKLRGLDDRELVEFMSRNMAEREPFYGQAALTIDGGAMSDDEILEFITEKLKERNG